MWLALACAGAWANGQSTHLWITKEAVAELPPGELRDLLSDPEVQDALLSGAMFPDGGYAVDHPYGETAHWEPFRDAYLAWIRANYAPPYSGDGAKHVAFLLGLASHGMADEVFDSLYFNWSRETDAAYGWAEGRSFDEASDTLWCAAKGAQTHPETYWVPYDVFVGLYADLGVTVSVDTMSDGQAQLGLAVDLVGFSSQQPDTRGYYEALFPWGGTHLDDPAFPGNPPDEARYVALYWQSVWARLHGLADPAFVLDVVPGQADPYGWTADHTTVRSYVSVVLARGLNDAEVGPEDSTVATADGAAQTFDVDVFYGQDAHVVHLMPAADWPADTDLNATLLAGFDASTDGSALASDFTWAFSTRPPPADDVAATGSAAPEGGCDTRGGTSQAPGLAAVIAAVLARTRRPGRPVVNRI